MAKNDLARWNPVFVVVLIGVSCIVLVSIRSAGISRPAQGEAVQTPKKILLGNRTRSLEITKAELSGHGNTVRVAIKNVSNKNISWFKISLGGGTAIEADCLLSPSAALSPDESYEDEYPFESTSDQVQITVVSVLFEDSISEGDEHDAAIMRAERSGQKMALTRLIPLLHKATEDSSIRQPSSISLLRNLESGVLDTQSEDSPKAEMDLETEAKLRGIQTIKQRLRNEIERVKVVEAKGDTMETQQKLKSVNERYDKIMANLRDYDF